MSQTRCIDSIEVKEWAYQQIFNTPTDGSVDFYIGAHQEPQEASEQQRKDAQNDLLWVWNKQKASHTGLKPNFIHGLDKMEILLPLYKSWGGAALRRAEFIEESIAHIPKFEIRVAVSYDMVRTKNLSIKRMSEYLSEVQRESAVKGIRLESNSDFEFKSLMVYADQINNGSNAKRGE